MSAPDWLTEDAGRRVTLEAQRAGAYLLVRRSRDPIAAARVRERVRDAEAFRVLVGCQGKRDKAAALLADLEAQRMALSEAEALAARLRRRRRRAYAEIQCGTLSGYERHRKSHEVPCDPCRDAYNTWRRERRRAAKRQEQRQEVAA